MSTLLRNVTKVITALGLSLSMMVAVAPAAHAAAPTNATISETRWLIGETKAATLTWTTGNTITTVLVRSPWPWDSSFVNGETQTATGASLSTTGAQTATCTDSNSRTIVFSFATATVGGTAPVCNYRVDTEWEGFWLSNISVAANSSISVSVGSGLVTAPPRARRDTWLVGELKSVGDFAYDGTKQSEVTVEAYAPAQGKVGFDPATDTAPTGPVKLVLNADQTEATCIAPAYTIAPDRYIYAFYGNGASIGEPIGTTAASHKIPVPKYEGIGLRLTCFITAFANHSAFSAAADAQVGSSLEAEGPPKTPGNVKAIALINAILVTWDAAVSRGYGITNYLATSTPSNRYCITTMQDVSLTRCLFIDVTAGTNYTFTAQALNGMGWGERSAASNSVAPMTLRITKYDRKKTWLGLQQEVSISGKAPGIAAGTQITGKVKIGNGAWKDVAVKVGADGNFSWTRTLKGNDRKLPVEFNASYAIPGIEDLPVTDHFKSITTKTISIKPL